MSRGLRVLRDAWLVVGIVALMAGVLEVGYRLYGEARRSLGEHAGGVGEQAGLDSLSVLLARHEDSTFNLQWHPYVYFRRRQVQTGLMSVDQSGLRVTPQVLHREGVDTLYMFGGSTMWGSFQRDSFTIAAKTATALERARRGVHVVIYGETGYVMNQELVTLLRALQAGSALQM